MNITIDEPFLQKCLASAYPNSRIAIKEYTSSAWAPDSGAHFISQLYRVHIDYERDNQPTSEFLLIKVPATAENFEFFGKSDVYDTEVNVYDVLLPAMACISSVMAAPRHYYTSESKVLVLEDLNRSGYQMERGITLDFEHCRSVLLALSKFHAVSARVAQQQPHLLSWIQNKASIYGAPIINGAIETTYPLMNAALRREGIDSTTLHKFGASLDNLRQNFHNLGHISDRRSIFCVLNHGDIRNENICFKYDDAGKLFSLKIFDYQISHWNSPVCDLMYFTILAVDYADFENRYDELLDGYLTTLNAMLTNLGCDCTYTRADYDADVEGSRLYQIFALVILGFVIINSVEGKCIVGDDGVISNEDKFEAICNSVVFKQQFVRWVRYFNDKGYFD